MKVAALLIIVQAASICALGDEGISIPWSEFKDLYRESIKRELAEQAAAPAKEPQVYSINEARYKLRIGSASAEGEVFLSGKVISGEAEAIPLFSPEVVITQITNVAGGTILAAQDESGMSFFPDRSVPEFQLTAAFMVRPQEDIESRVISFSIPPAVQNSLELTLPPNCRLAEEPGVASADGSYHLSASRRLTVSYVDIQGVAAATEIEMDAISRLSFQENRLLITTFFHPIRAVPTAVLLQAPENAKYISSSLKSSWIRSLENNQYELNVPQNEQGVFSIEFSLEMPPDSGNVSFLLPVIVGNTGQQGRLVVQEPENGQATVAANGLVSQIPTERLGEVLSKSVEGNRTYSGIPPNEPVELTLTRLQPIQAPTAVLDSLRFFSSFEENGNILSILVMDVAPEVGPRLRMKAIPDGEIWSLSVNNVKRDVYSDGQGAWIIPLAGNEPSHVEFAFLRKGPKLALQGRLDLAVPETGLPSQNVYVGIALPARVELLSLEGPVSPAPGQADQLPAEFVGKQYFFSRAFHNGEEMKLAISYKEPLNNVEGKETAQ